ncbi:hypothetical protein GCM10009856_29390 [Mycolicibacterium llatzerense]
MELQHSARRAGAGGRGVMKRDGEGVEHPEDQWQYPGETTCDGMADIATVDDENEGDI